MKSFSQKRCSLKIKRIFVLPIFEKVYQDELGHVSLCRAMPQLLHLFRPQPLRALRHKNYYSNNWSQNSLKKVQILESS